MDYLTLFSKGESFQSELIITKGHIQSDPFFSIFIPTFNRPDLLKKLYIVQLARILKIIMRLLLLTIALNTIVLFK